MLADKSAHTELTAEEKNKAERAFEDSVLHWNAQTHNQTNRIPMWSSIRELCYQLNTQPQKAPRDDLVLGDVQLRRAVVLVNRAEERLMLTCPVVPRTILLLAASDCWKHTGEIPKAIDAAKKAQNIAETFDLQKEIRGSKERLDKLGALSVLPTEHSSKVPTSVDDAVENTRRVSTSEEFERCLAEQARINELENQRFQFATD